MNALLIYPPCPDTFWSFKYAIRFVFKKALHPPLGLVTVAALLPRSWEKRLVDMNVEALSDKHLQWADYAFISAMAVQRESVKKVIKQCVAAGVKIVAGGPLFTASHQDFRGVDHFVLNEAELTLHPFLEDLEKGQAKPIYSSDQFSELRHTPAPLWPLLKMKKYFSMTTQYSRGCPFNCEFCDITTLYGRRPRCKTGLQIMAELESLYQHGWRGNVFMVDDNFIGNKAKLKSEILPALIEWSRKKKRPFVFSTEASIDLSDDEELMEMMALAGFDGVFVGIESPSDDSLKECNKHQNTGRDLVGSVQKIQAKGLQVRGGFIVGFDSDSPNIFQKQIDFIQNSGIITAMVGLLNAPRGSNLYHRLRKEGRLLQDVSGDNTDCTTNFIPKMGQEALLKGYEKIIQGIYSARPYYERVRGFLKSYRPLEGKITGLHISGPSEVFRCMGAFLRALFVLGIKDKHRIHYWKLMFWTLFKRPFLIPQAITYAIYGFHFRKVFAQYLGGAAG